MIYRRGFVSFLLVLPFMSVSVSSERSLVGVTTLRHSSLVALRGGLTDLPPPSKRTRTKTKKRKKPPSTAVSSKEALEEEKKVIGQAMREKDAATALGDAIRDRADQFRSELDNNPTLQKIDQSVSSVGFAMGTSDPSAVLESNDVSAVMVDDDGGGVEASFTSVLANYFLKSHGGAHAVQCICSLLAALSATAALLIPPKSSSTSSSSLRLILMKRTMLFAMTKHISGLLAATSMTATAIPQVGLRKARLWIQQLARDPVSQYIFYAALLMLWLPSSSSFKDGIWWMDGNAMLSRLAPLCLVGPILLREATSTAFVISDILLLWTTSSSGGKEDTPRLVQIGHGGMNAFMSVLVTPNVWRTADAATKQEILAKVTSRTSLLLELCVGVLLSFDAVLACIDFALRPATQRPSLTDVLRRLFCARLYLNFLWVRRRKIVKLGMQLRGGAAEFPFRLMELVLHPQSSMGIDVETKSEIERSWIDYAIVGLGMDE